MVHSEMVHSIMVSSTMVHSIMVPSIMVHSIMVPATMVPPLLFPLQWFRGKNQKALPFEVLFNIEEDLLRENKEDKNN